MLLLDHDRSVEMSNRECPFMLYVKQRNRVGWGGGHERGEGVICLIRSWSKDYQCLFHVGF